jgi:ABC-type polysaccharide/polyol phosphate export permease
VRAVGKNAIIFAHNAIILALVLAIFGVRPGWFLVLSLIGLGLLLGNLVWLGVVFGTIGARFRDFPPIVSSALTLSFYVTPIIWQPESLPAEFRDMVVLFNPLFHLMELVRQPLLGEIPGVESFGVALTLLVVGSGLALLVSNRFGWRIVYWM